MVASEPLLRVPNDENRLSINSNADQKIKEFCDQHLGTVWTANEIDFRRDVQLLKEMSEREPEMYGTIVSMAGFLAVADGLVSNNLVHTFMSEIKIPVVLYFLAVQLFIENVHGDTYNKQLEACTNDPEKIRQFRLLYTRDPSIRAKIAWVNEHTDASKHSFQHRLVAATINEGLFFTVIFAIIFYLKYSGYKLEGIIQANEFISRDEGLHMRFFSHLYRHHVESKLPEAEVVAMMQSAVEAEFAFIETLLQSHPQTNLLNVENTKQYAKYVADSVMLYLGLSPIYRVANPYDFVNNSLWVSKDDFFAVKSSTYSNTELPRQDLGAAALMELEF